MRLIKKAFKIILLVAGALITILLIIFFALTQRDLNRAHKLVKERMTESAARYKPAPNNFVAAFEIAFPEESPHHTYVGYLCEHNLSYMNEQLNMMTTRIIAYSVKTDLARLLELDYQIHNLERSEKINFVFNEGGKIYADFREWSLKKFKKNAFDISICHNIFLLHDVLNKGFEFGKIAAKTDEAISAYLSRTDIRYREDLMKCKDTYKNIL